uniref:CSON002555 protein n=1 Tax=Culicoides sonorensis TaxID=179676 RepID=A0A336MKQ7_CULSO
MKQVMVTANKDAKEAKNNKIISMSEANGILNRVLGDVSKKSAAQQILLGAGSGWATGYVTMKVGKAAALAVGGGIILLQLAHQQGYITVDWNKVTRKFDKVSDKVTEAVTKEKPGLLDKAERYVDRAISSAEDTVNKKRKQAKNWYASFIGDNNGVKVNDFHIFLLSFVAGVSLGIGTA